MGSCSSEPRICSVKVACRRKRGGKSCSVFVLETERFEKYFSCTDRQQIRWFH
uniref:Uncharacterized protein n=1 Tax=Arundo donax TaxID=35708 RepID=A0A0A9E7Q1_ARUDO